MSPSTASCVFSLKCFFHQALTAAFDAHALPECVDALASLKIAGNASVGGAASSDGWLVGDAVGHRTGVGGTRA